MRIEGRGRVGLPRHVVQEVQRRDDYDAPDACADKHHLRKSHTHHRPADTRPDRRPNRTASAQSGRYRSSRRPRTFGPVSMTVYVPLYRASRPANLITVPRGKTFGSAATTPL